MANDFLLSSQKALSKGWGILTIFLGGFFLWAFLAPLDQGVVATGYIVPDGLKKLVQHPLGGTVEEILVTEGQSVSAGQPLIRLNQVQLDAQLTMIQATIEGDKKTVEALKVSVSKRQAQFEAALAQQKSYEKLLQSGHVSKFQLLELNKQVADVATELSIQKASLEQAKTRMSESLQKIKAIDYDVSKAVIQSPIDGQVFNLTVNTASGVIQAGAVLMELVPKDAKYIVDLQVPLTLMDKLTLNQDVEVSFVGLNSSWTPRIKASLMAFSQDRVVNPKDNQSFIIARAGFNDTDLAKIHQLGVRFGTPVQAFFKVGDRTLASYLVRPLTDRLKYSLIEP
jgi:protease secretion system membrane fusion protein